MKLSYQAPAKINLTLDVLYKRDDGYHEVEMVMTSIDLADRIEFSLLPQKKIHVDSSASFVPTDERNLAYQAAKKIQDRFQIEQGVSLYIHKKIPVAAGLGGGSSDAAAVIKGLNRLWKLGLSLEEMAVIGAEVGSDVPFCIYGGTALAKGRGELITPISAPPPFWVVLAKPPIGVSTADIYSQLNLSGMKESLRTKRMIEAIREGSYSKIVSNLGNALEQVTLREYPQVRQIKRQMERFGADGVLMSGSGPTVFALTAKQNRAQRIYNGLKGFCKDVYTVRCLRQRNA